MKKQCVLSVVENKCVFVEKRREHKEPQDLSLDAEDTVILVASHLPGCESFLWWSLFQQMLAMASQKQGQLVLELEGVRKKPHQIQEGPSNLSMSWRSYRGKVQSFDKCSQEDMWLISQFILETVVAPQLGVVAKDLFSKTHNTAAQLPLKFEASIFGDLRLFAAWIEYDPLRYKFYLSIRSLAKDYQSRIKAA